MDVNARDNYGNTLFILVCQQGNKRLAKFLMRRHADMDLQVRLRGPNHSLMTRNKLMSLHTEHEWQHSAALSDRVQAQGVG